MYLAFTVVKISGPPAPSLGLGAQATRPCYQPVKLLKGWVGWIDISSRRRRRHVFGLTMNDMNFEAADIRNRRCMYEHLERSSVSSVGLEHCSDESSVLRRI